MKKLNLTGNVPFGQNNRTLLGVCQLRDEKKEKFSEVTQIFIEALISFGLLRFYERIQENMTGMTKAEYFQLQVNR